VTPRPEKRWKVHELAGLLGDGGLGLLETVRRHLDHVDQDLEGQSSLRAPLLEIRGMVERLIAPPADRFIEVLQGMS